MFIFFLAKLILADIALQHKDIAALRVCIFL